MASRLINVRLDAERLRKARLLRSRGVVLSDLVREAIDARYAQLGETGPRNPRELMKRILAAYPDPPGLPPRNYDVHDRREAREGILKRLRRKR